VQPTAIQPFFSHGQLKELWFGVALTAIAGCVDAVGFLYTGRFFVSFMSGDTTQLAVAAGQSRWPEACAAGGIVTAFVLAVAVGRMLDLRLPRWGRPAVLYSEALLLAVAAYGAFATKVTPVLLMVAAMGIQNALHNRQGGKLGPTYITGVLVNMGHALADALSSHSGRWHWAPYFLLWSGLVSGAVLGTVLDRALQLRGLYLPVAALLALGTGAASAAAHSWARRR
jgi:uncharacterized membrane protein YoaK (UPF0700 family)